jgi:hypothetical protein
LQVLRLQALRRMEIFPWSMVAAATTDALGAIGFAAPPSIRRRRKLAGVKQHRQRGAKTRRRQLRPPAMPAGAWRRPSRRRSLFAGG